MEFTWPVAAIDPKQSCGWTEQKAANQLTGPNKNFAAYSLSSRPYRAFSYAGYGTRRLQLLRQRRADVNRTKVVFPRSRVARRGKVCFLVKDTNFTAIVIAIEL